MKGKKGAKPALTLSPEVAAALASGASVNLPEAPKAEEVETDTSAQATDENTDTQANAGEGGEGDGAAETQANAETADNGEPQAETKDQPAPQADPLVSHLKGELADARKETATHLTTIAELRVELKGITTALDAEKAKIAELTETQNKLADVVRMSAGRLATALRSSTVGFESLSAAQLIERFTELNTQFEKTFKIGPTSRVDAEDATVANTVDTPVNPVMQAARAATKLGKK